MENEIVIHNENDLRSKIYTIRGMQVMLDFDLAEIYGYSVKAFNQQVKNNIEKFEDDFRFQLNEYETQNLRSKILTANFSTMSRTNPYAFTEQGIYMLMTVLRGDLAIKQSKILIRLFKTMKDFIIERENFIGYDEVAKLAIQTSQNMKEIAEMKTDIVAVKADVARIIEDFSNNGIKKDFLFLNEKVVEADLAYQQIYALAEKSIFVIDNYISLKTLVLLKSVTADHEIYRSLIENLLKHQELVL